jgi:anionic cell wall polymer biosynthesis LytR-Cps2A-Psr (LCP) family protein
MLIFFFNISTGSQSEVYEVKEIATFTPFIRNSNNTIVDRREYEYKEAVHTAEQNNTEIKTIRTSTDFNKDIPFKIDENAGVVYKKKYNGRRINVAVIGVDSRLGSRYKHADANHVLSIMPESGEIEITSIPRDTYADAGYPDTTTFNTISNLRARNGRKAYLKRIAEIAELDTIHFYMEFGFSQAIGLLEWLGYENSKQTLQVLRSRKVFAGGDWQRTYNQGVFINQAIRKSFKNYGGVFGDLVLMGGLSLVETNINLSTLTRIVNLLREGGFGDEEDIVNRVRPKYKYKFKQFDFNNDEVVASLQSKVNEHSKNKSNVSIDSLVLSKMDVVLNKAIKSDSLGKATKTINTLKTFFRQRAWLQISDKKVRHEYREKMKNLLVSAYIQKNQPENADKIKRIVEHESNLFLYNLNKSDLNYNMLKSLVK